MTSKEKQLTIKRILIYLVLAFVPVYLICILGSDKDCNFKTMFGSLSIMWYPAIANFATRAITKEGFEDSYLRINMKGNKKYYIIAALLPIVMGALSGIVHVVMQPEGYSFSRGITELGGGKMIAALLLSGVASCVSQFDRGFGEEFGWRAYLTPKLEKLMPSTLAITVNGVIWGLWHAPLIAKGYNFGTEVHPAIAVTMMCVSCVILSFILTWLTKRTGSVYPAALFHIVIDVFNTSMLSIFVFGIKDFDFESHEFRTAAIMMCIVPLIAAVPAAIAMVRKKTA